MTPTVLTVFTRTSAGLFNKSPITANVCLYTLVVFLKNTGNVFYPLPFSLMIQLRTNRIPDVSKDLQEKVKRQTDVELLDRLSDKIFKVRDIDGARAVIDEVLGK